MRTPGFYPDIPEPEYHGDRGSLSVSGAKVLLKAPALFRWQQDHPVYKDVFDFGTAAHALVLGIGAPIEVIEVEVTAIRDGEKVKIIADSWAFKAASEARDKARAEGKTPLLPADYAHVQAMADALSSHKLAMRLLTDGQPEVSAYAEDPETGVTRRGRFDWLGPSVLTDYKTSASVDPRDLAGRYGSIKKWGYDQQAAWYTDLARDLGHPAKAFAFVFQMKEPPYLVTVAQVHDDDLWDARERNRRALALYAECVANDYWPGFIPDDTAALVSLTDQNYVTELVA